MKFIIISALMCSLSGFAQTNPQDCIKIKNKIDRKYCVDKYLEALKEKNDAEKKSWGAGLPQATKDEKSRALEQDIQAKKDLMGLVQSEIEVSEKQLAELKALPVAAAAAPAKPAKKEKKKKKGGFKIKL